MSSPSTPAWRRRVRTRVAMEGEQGGQAVARDATRRYRATASAFVMADTWRRRHRHLPLTTATGVRGAYANESAALQRSTTSMAPIMDGRSGAGRSAPGAMAGVVRVHGLSPGGDVEVYHNALLDTYETGAVSRR